MLGTKVHEGNAERLCALGMAGMLHDLGKLAIDPGLLSKPGKLSPEEMNLIHQHPIESARLVGDLSSVAPEVRQMIVQHHERMDGRGYPLGLTGAQLDAGSRILTIVDAYHAITGPRAYRAPLTPVEANRVLGSLAGRQFDAELLAAWQPLCTARGIQPPAAWEAPGDEHNAEELSARHEHRAYGTSRSEIRQRTERLQCDGKVSADCIYVGRLKGLSDAPDRFDCLVHDLSRGGVCLHTAHPMFRGEVVHVRVKGQEHSVWVAGVVAWCRQEQDGTGFRCGVRFRHLVAEGRVGTETDVFGLDDTFTVAV
jgi:hypothetical protein